MFNIVGQPVVRHSDHLEIYACASPRRGWSFWVLNVTQHNTNFVSFADGNDEDFINSQFGQAPSSLVPEDHIFQRHGETREQFHEQFKDEEYMENFQKQRKFFLVIFETSFIEPRITGRIKDTMPCIASRNNSRNIVHEHRRASGHCEVSVARAASRTAAHMTSGFRDIEKNADPSTKARIIVRKYFRVSPRTRSSEKHSSS